LVKGGDFWIKRERERDKESVSWRQAQEMGERQEILGYQKRERVTPGSDFCKRGGRDWRFY